MESLTGIVERVTFFTEETGYCVVKVSLPGRPDTITLTGKVPEIHCGEQIEAAGEWIMVPNWGRQFRAEHIRTSTPATPEGIEKYLGSGLIEGIGPQYAKRLVAKFGAHIFDVIDQESKRLQEVEGIGEKRRKEIKSSWEQQKAVRDIMVFLHQHGISTAKAVKIYQTYGALALNYVKDDPYKLAQDIAGIGFRTADDIARKVGMELENPRRIRAGLLHCLASAGDDGHCALPETELLSRTAALLGMDAALLPPHVQDLIREGDMLLENRQPEPLIFLPHLARAEERIASRLRDLLAAPCSLPEIDAATAIPWAEQQTGIQLAPAQREAVEAALRHKVLIITGGPGVGKTTILNSILKILRAKQVRCILAAPTGRASRRMSETTGMEAKTIHRLLDFQPGKGFTRNISKALDGDFFVLDETSMVDTPLCNAYLQALPQKSHLLLVGDADQLPSVGPGNILRDLLASEKLPWVRLTEIFRQAATSQIISAAHAINSGKIPNLDQPRGSDFFFIQRNSPEDIVATIIKIARERIPAAYGLDPVKDVQILTPMNRGALGTVQLNRTLQDALNPGNEMKPEVERFNLRYRQGDKVIQIRNNYDKDVFNGDIGLLVDIHSEPISLEVRFDGGRLVKYTTGDLDELRPAYAITIHKSQGSEFPIVIIPVSTQHYVMLQRNLIYTGVTRGKKCVILVGDAKALEIAVQNTSGLERWTGLQERLVGADLS